MPLPTPSPQQVASLTALKAVADAGVTGADEKIAAIQTAIDVQQDAEDFQKSTFDALNDDIIRNYEMERRWIDGQLVENPIIEDDLQDFSNKETASRIWNGGQYTPARIDEFDGLPLAYQGDDNEDKLFGMQDEVIDKLVNGIPGQILLSGTAVLATAIDENSTSMTVEGNTNPININDVILVLSGADAAVIKVTSATAGGYCTGEATPPQLTEPACTGDGGTWTNSDTIGFEYLIEPTGTLGIGTPVGQKTWSGFNNTERTNKTASDSDLQPILDSLLNSLRTVLEDRVVVLQNEIQAIQNNQNDLLPANVETDAQSSLTAVQGFLGVSPPSTIDISDTGLTAIDNEKSIREPQIIQRITDIAAEIATGDGSESFYDKRFNTASGRAHLANGSITLLRELNEAKAGNQAGKALAQGLSARYADLIP